MSHTRRYALGMFCAAITGSRGENPAHAQPQASSTQELEHLLLQLRNRRTLKDIEREFENTVILRGLDGWDDRVFGMAAFTALGEDVASGRFPYGFVFLGKNVTLPNRTDKGVVYSGTTTLPPDTSLFKTARDFFARVPAGVKLIQPQGQDEPRWEAAIRKQESFPAGKEFALRTLPTKLSQLAVRFASELF